MTSKLFAAPVGTPGTPTIVELFAECPKDFKLFSNQWYRLAAKVRSGGVNATNWKFKTTDPSERERQLLCMVAMTAAPHMLNDPEATTMCDSIAAWMFSEALSELPDYVRLTQRA